MMNSRPKTGQESCPKCGGNIYMDSDEHGWFEHCLQCGHTRDIEVIIAGNVNKLMKPNGPVNQCSND